MQVASTCMIGSLSSLRSVNLYASRSCFHARVYFFCLRLKSIVISAAGASRGYSQFTQYMLCLHCICEPIRNFLFTCYLCHFFVFLLFLASADKVSITSKELSHVVDVKEPKTSKKKVKIKPRLKLYRF